MAAWLFSGLDGRDRYCVDKGGFIVRKYAIMAVASALVLPSNASAAEIVRNGGFETGDLSGWTQGGNPDFTGVAGDSAANSGRFGAVLGSRGSPGSLSQMLNTGTNRTYTISFALANSGGTPNSFSVSFQGKQFFVRTDSNVFRYFTFNFPATATGAASLLQFDFQNDRDFWYLDDVSVLNQAGGVPEPATWAMMLAGFGVVGGAMRRRRNVKVSFATT